MGIQTSCGGHRREGSAEPLAPRGAALLLDGTSAADTERLAASLQTQTFWTGLDATDPDSEIRRKIRLAARTLFPNVPSDSVIPILTKADLRSPEAIAARAEILAESEFHRPPLSLSVRGGHGLSELREVIERTFAFPLELHLVLPEDAEAPSKLNWLYEHAEVVSVVHGPDRIEIVARCRLDDRERIERLGRVLLSRSLE